MIYCNSSYCWSPFVAINNSGLMPVRLIRGEPTINSVLPISSSMKFLSMVILENPPFPNHPAVELNVGNPIANKLTVVEIATIAHVVYPQVHHTFHLCMSGWSIVDVVTMCLQYSITKFQFGHCKVFISSGFHVSLLCLNDYDINYTTLNSVCQMSI